jgi:hypothetical protein
MVLMAVREELEAVTDPGDRAQRRWQCDARGGLRALPCAGGPTGTGGGPASSRIMGSRPLVDAPVDPDVAGRSPPGWEEWNGAP